jgi:hypothetical protein
MEAALAGDEGEFFHNANGYPEAQREAMLERLNGMLEVHTEDRIAEVSMKKQSVFRNALPDSMPQLDFLFYRARSADGE